MKTKKTELDVDVMGGLGPLTKAEEQRISEYIKFQKAAIAKKHVRKARVVRTKRAA